MPSGFCGGASVGASVGAGSVAGAEVLDGGAVVAGSSDEESFSAPQPENISATHKTVNTNRLSFMVILLLQKSYL
jgi:hypothetical protein